MDPIDYVFRIDAFTPDDLPMARLAIYLAELAKLLGHAEHTHFVRIDPGSARLVHRVDAVDAPKVEARLNSVRLGDGPKDAMAARRQLDELLANDNAIGELQEVASGQVVVSFIGRDRPKTISFPPFRQNTAIQGQIVNIGGRDETAHATLQDGAMYHVNVSMKRNLARQLAPLLYGPVVRLHGNGRFERQPDGIWKMLDFRVDRYEPLDEKSIAETLATVRALPGNGIMRPDSYQIVTALAGEADEPRK